MQIFKLGICSKSADVILSQKILRHQGIYLIYQLGSPDTQTSICQRNQEWEPRRARGGWENKIRPRKGNQLIS